MLRNTIPICLFLFLYGCSGNQNGSDGGQDGGHQPWGRCPFPYTVPGEHPLYDEEMGREVNRSDIHLRCRIDFEDLDAEVFVKAEPTEIQSYGTVVYSVKEAFVCRGDQVEALPEGMAEFGKIGRHSWKSMEVAFDQRRYFFSMGETCIGARPCTPWPDQFDVRRLDDGSLIAEAVPTECAGVGPNGVPAPLVPLARIPLEGGGAMGAEETPFSMGSEDGDTDERPVNTFNIFSSRMDTREATNDDFALFLNDQGNDCDGHACVDPQGDGFRIDLEDGTWRPREGYENRPVVHVSWYGASAYCRWRRMMLPMEADWEIAASALGERRYPWGDGEPTCDLALFDACGATGPEAVCSREPGNSRECICDLAGNVSEWIKDWYQADFYQTCRTSGSCGYGPSLPTGTNVVRGGSFAQPAHNLRATDRNSADPATTTKDLGLRCVTGNPSG